MYKSYNHLLDAYYDTVEYIAENGVPEITEDGEKTLALLEPLTIRIEHPTTTTGFPYGLKRQAADVYAEQMIHPLRDTTHPYTYGQRLRTFASETREGTSEALSPVDQVNVLINRLNVSKSSRRAVAVLYNPLVDSSRDEIPCMNHIQFRIVDGKLDCYVVFRSQDMLSAWFLNCYAISRLMDYVRNYLKTWCEKGCLYITSNCPHIYHERDADVLSRVITEGEIRKR